MARIVVIIVLHVLLQCGVQGSCTQAATTGESQLCEAEGNMIALHHECNYVDYGAVYALLTMGRSEGGERGQSKEWHLREHNSCLYSCFTFALDCQPEGRYRCIQELRELSVYLWKVLDDKVLGLDLSQQQH